MLDVSADGEGANSGEYLSPFRPLRLVRPETG